MPDDTVWPATSQEFRTFIFHAMFAHLDASEEDNVDGTYPPHSLSLTPEAYRWRQAGYLGFLIENHEALFEALLLLADEASRRLFVELILFRILGHTRVRLSSNTDRFWQAKDTASRLPAGESPFGGVEGGKTLRRFEIVLDGQVYRIDCLPANMLFSFFLRQYYLDRSDASVRPQRGDHVVDAGACLGDTAIGFAHAVGSSGKVHAFDPVEIHQHILRHNIAQNPGIENVTTHATGLGDADIVGPLSAAGIDPGFVATGADGPLRRLDALVAEGAIERVDFIKMDIEGHELAALRGAEQVLRRFRPKLAISLYHRPEDYFRIPRYLAGLGLGYRFWLENYTISDGETVLYAAV